MGSTEFGAPQILSFDYNQDATSKLFNRTTYGLMAVGIHSGFTLSRATSSSVTVSSGYCYMQDSTNITGVRIETSQSVTLSVSNSTPYIILRFSWQDTQTNYMDMLAVAYTDIHSDDLIVGRCVYNDSGTDFSTTFDLTRRSCPFTKDTKTKSTYLRVTPTEPATNQVVISSGVVITAYGLRNVAGGSYPSGGFSNTTNGRTDIIYVDDIGNVKVVEGVDSSSPIAPHYGSKKVIAEIRRGASRTSVKGNEIYKVENDFDIFPPTVDLVIADAYDLYTAGNVEDALQEIAGSNFTFEGTKTFENPITSTVATGTAPLTIASTTKVTNLNTDKVDGYDASESATVSTLVARTSDGRAKIAAPTENDDAATKEYVDSKSSSGSADGNIGYNFANRQFEVNTDGWNTYKDSALPYPGDGMGGVPSTISFARYTSSTDTPLAGLASGRLSKSSANGQGEGLSYDFTIDTGNLSSVAQIAFLYRTSTNYVGGELGIYIYDITNAKLVPCSLVDLPKTDDVVGSTFATTFIPNNNSINYRLIFHIQSVYTTPWTFDIDNIQVGQKQNILGASVTPWVDYASGSYVFGTQNAVSFAAGKCPIGAVTTNPTKGTTSEDHAQWMRDGQDMLVKMDYKQTSAGTTGNGVYLFALPAGYTIDLTKNPVGSVVGGGILSSNADEYTGGSASADVKVYSATMLQFIYYNPSTGVGSPVTSASYGYGVATLTYRFSARFTCAQFSVNSTFVGVNEPFYLSNSETAINTNGVVGKTKLGIDGSPLLANTATTYFDMTLPRALLSNETPIIQLRSKINGAWVNAADAGVSSLYLPHINQSFFYTGNIYQRGITLLNITSGVIRVLFTAGPSSSPADWNSGTEVIRTWASIIAAADGYDAWRVRIGQANTAEQIDAWHKYISNSQSTVNTNGTVANTVDGPSAIIANTVTTSYDMAIPSGWVFDRLEVRSKVDQEWIPVEEATMMSMAGSLAPLPHLSVANTAYGVGVIKITSGQVRVRFFGAAGVNFAPAGVTWQNVLDAADGYNAWRVVLKRKYSQ